jgi:hypothetical protein
MGVSENRVYTPKWQFYWDDADDDDGDDDDDNDADDDGKPLDLGSALFWQTMTNPISALWMWSETKAVKHYGFVFKDQICVRLSCSVCGCSLMPNGWELGGWEASSISSKRPYLQWVLTQLRTIEAQVLQFIICCNPLSFGLFGL